MARSTDSSRHWYLSLSAGPPRRGRCNLPTFRKEVPQVFVRACRTVHGAGEARFPLGGGLAPSGKKNVVCPKKEFDRWMAPVGAYVSLLPTGVDGVGWELPGDQVGRDAVSVLTLCRL